MSRSGGRSTAGGVLSGGRSSRWDRLTATGEKITTTTRPRRPAAFARLRRVIARRRPTVICETCELTGGPFEPAEAEHLRALHASLHHGQPLPRPPVTLPDLDRHHPG